MKPIVKKISKPLALKIRLIIGAITMGLAMIVLPITLLFVSPELFLNPYIIGTCLIVALLFGLIGYGYFVRPFRLFPKVPDVQVEADDEFLYIHTLKKEAKIPFTELTFADVDVSLPFQDQPSVILDFWEEILTHYCAEEYGTLTLDIDGFGKYKFYFVAYAEETSDQLISFIQKAMNSAE